MSLIEKILADPIIKTNGCTCGKSREEYDVSIWRLKLDIFLFIVLIGIVATKLALSPFSFETWNLFPTLALLAVIVKIVGILLLAAVFATKGHKTTCAARKGFLIMSTFARKRR